MRVRHLAVGGLPSPDAELRVVEDGRDLDELGAWVEARRDLPLGQDNETNARDPWEPAFRLRTAQFADPWTAWVVPVPDRSLWRRGRWVTREGGLAQELAGIVRRHPRWVCHYSEADTRFLSRGLPGEPVRWSDAEPHFWDTQPLLALYDPRTVTTSNKRDRIDPRIPLKRGLKPTASRLLTPSLEAAERRLTERFRELAPVGHRVGKKLKTWGFANVDAADPVFEEYAALDPLVEVRLFWLLRARLEEAGLWPAADHDLRQQWYTDGQSYRGLPVDEAHALWLDGELARAVAERAPALAERGVPPSAMGPAVGAAMAALGEPVRRWNRHPGRPATPSWDRHALEAVAEGGGPGAALARTVREVRRAAKFRETYVAPMLWSCRNADGVMHYSKRAYGTITTRAAAQKTATSGPVDQLPKQDTRVRACVRAPRGWLLVSADLSQGEPFTMAALSGDRRMLADLTAPHPALGKPDFNAVGASTVYGEAFDARRGKVAGTPDYLMRQAFKFDFLAWCYGAQPPKLAELLSIPQLGLRFTPEDGERVQAGWVARWPDLGALRESLGRLSAVRLDTGHSVPLWDRWYVDEAGELRVSGRPSRLGLNAATQGTQAQLLKWARHRVFAEGWGWALRFDLHDELLGAAPAWMAGDLRAVLERCMTLTYRGVTLRCEASVEGETWQPQRRGGLDPAELAEVDDEEEAV